MPLPSKPSAAIPSDIDPGNCPAGELVQRLIGAAYPHSVVDYPPTTTQGYPCQDPRALADR